MRKTLLFIFVLSLFAGGYAQQRAVVSKSLRDKAVKYERQAVKFTNNHQDEYIPGERMKSLVEDTQIGETRYDLQTNSSCQNRIYLYDDGTMASVWTLGFDDPGFDLRGTGYNYHDGSAWGPEPTERIEEEWTGWPSYAPYGENGEMVVNHTYVDGLWVGTRAEKGTGTWNYNYLAGPPGAVDISWPRAITAGPDNNTIHTLYTTFVTYNGQTNAMGYSRSTDGGLTWDPEHLFFEDFGPDYYITMAGDIYDWAEPNAGTIAFLAGEAWTDLVLMKSTDNGDTWDKTIVWECPYPLNSGTATDTFYCADGSHHLAIDNSGKVHVVFGINRTYSDGASSFWFPFVDGVGYWNEDMPTFSDDLNALSPYGDPGTELVEDVNLIGWSQDLNGNGELDLLEELGTYFIGLSSMVQIAIDDLDQVFVVYSSGTEGYDNGTQNYRHLWTRASGDAGNTWGPFVHLNENLIYIFEECVFPSISPTTDIDNFYLIYQADSEPGLAVRGDEDPYGDNYIRVMTVAKEDVIDGVEDHEILTMNNVSQNYPNPFTGSSAVYVTLDEPAELGLSVTNLMGQVVYELPVQKYPAGKSEMVIEGGDLTSGVYFYTVKNGQTSVTRKMIVE